MIAFILFGIAGAGALIGSGVIILAKTGEQDTLGGAIVLGAAVIAALGGLLHFAGV